VLHVFSGPAASHTVVIDTERRAYCWGRNEEGQLGLGDTVNRYAPTAVLPGERIKSGACGPNHTMLFTTMGALFAAGANGSGQLGTGLAHSKTAFVRIEGMVEVVSVACGREFTAAVNADGEVYTWGHPEHGQLGNGGEYKTLEKAGKWTYQLTKHPTKVDALLGVSVATVCAGPNHTAVSRGLPVPGAVGLLLCVCVCVCVGVDAGVRCWVLRWVGWVSPLFPFSLFFAGSTPWH
jgi:alpha-tubulin suppressor-like RCC1 family protein